MFIGSPSRQKKHPTKGRVPGVFFITSEITPPVLGVALSGQSGPLFWRAFDAPFVLRQMSRLGAPC